MEQMNKKNLLIRQLTSNNYIVDILPEIMILV